MAAGAAIGSFIPVPLVGTVVGGLFGTWMDSEAGQLMGVAAVDLTGQDADVVGYGLAATGDALDDIILR